MSTSIFDQWLESVLSGAVLAVEAAASEEQKMVRWLEERRERIADPEKLQRMTDEVLARVTVLREKKNEMGRAVAALEEEVAQGCQKITQSVLIQCDQIMKTMRSGADQNLVRGVESLLAEQAQREFQLPVQSLVPAQLELLLRESGVLEAKRKELQAAFLREMEETARLAEYRKRAEGLRRRRGELQGTGKEEIPGLLADLRRQILDEHGVSPEVLEALLNLPEAERLCELFFQPWLNDSQIEKQWKVSSNILGEVKDGLGRSTTTTG